MRRIVGVFAGILAASALIGAAQQATGPAAPAGAMLTVDSIMRGPKLVGTAPAAVRWARDSSKVYFTWQRADETRPGTWTVGRDGTGLRKLSVEEARVIADVLPAGSYDRARKRLASSQSGDIVIIDVATGARRVVTRTSANESSPRWVRNDTAVTFIRDGNLFLASLDGSGPPLAQLTDIVAGDAPAPAVAAPQRGAGVGRGGGRAGGAGAAQGGRGDETAAQRPMREEELKLIDHLQRQQEDQAAARAGAPPPPPEDPIARFQLGPRQTLGDLQLSGDEKYVWVAVDERADGTARGQDVPNYVTTSAYPEMIPGRTNVGDVQGRRRLAALDVKSGKVVWADAADFAGSERKAAPADGVPRIVDWAMPDSSDDGSQT